MSVYFIQLQGQVDVNDLNPMSPHQMAVIERQPAALSAIAAAGADQTATLFAICTDQSGMIGLLRHLHSLGLVILSVAWQPEGTISVSERKD